VELSTFLELTARIELSEFKYGSLTHPIED
jgi:hypothetical protein